MTRKTWDQMRCQVADARFALGEPGVYAPLVGASVATCFIINRDLELQPGGFEMVLPERQTAIKVPKTAVDECKKGDWIHLFTGVSYEVVRVLKDDLVETHVIVKAR